MARSPFIIEVGFGIPRIVRVEFHWLRKGATAPRRVRVGILGRWSRRNEEGWPLIYLWDLWWVDWHILGPAPFCVSGHFIQDWMHLGFIQNVRWRLNGAHRRRHEAARLLAASYTLERQKKLVWAKTVIAGDRLTREHFAILSPGDGIAPWQMDRLIGGKAVCDSQANMDVTWEAVMTNREVVHA